ncbi:MAG: Helix-turn-helix protein [uncultured bacterium]|nr:MAG: Helix-turn-helix protein [uncultured bacterium]
MHVELCQHKYHMQYQLKQNINAIVKQKGLSIRKLERDAGLHKNFISNLLYDKSKNPGIDSIIKIAAVLDVSIDELVGKGLGHKTYDLAITRKDIFFDSVNYLLTAIQTKQNSTFKLENFFDAIYEIYTFSLKKDSFDREFADWFINCRL